MQVFSLNEYLGKKPGVNSTETALANAKGNSPKIVIAVPTGRQASQSEVMP